MNLEQIGGYALIAGVIIAILAGAVQTLAPSAMDQNTVVPWVVLAMVVLGLIVGFLNIKDTDTAPFLIAAIALIVTATGAANLVLIDKVTKVFGLGLGTMLQTIVLNIAVFVAPAALVVALKTVYTTASAAK